MRLIFTLFVFMALISISIISYSQCVQCDGNSNPSGNFASVIGMSTTATKDMAFAGGFNSHALGYFSFAFGNQVTADGANSLAFGRYVKSLASEAMIFGIGVDNSNFLTNSIPSSFMIGFNSNLPTLLVKKADGFGFTGKIGIGNASDPEGNLKAKLHIKGDNNEASLLLIEPNDPTTQSAILNIGTTAYGLKYSPSRLEFLTAGKFVFYSGNIGIGTYQPSERLEIVGNLKLTGNISQQTGYQVQTDKVIASGTKGLQLLNTGSKGIVIDNTGNVGINTSKPTANFQVNGKILTTQLQIPNTVVPDDSSKSVEGYVLCSDDAFGNVAWTPQSSLDDGDWTKSGNNVYRATGNVGIGLTNPTCPFEVKKSGITSDWTYVARLTVEGTSANNTKVISVKNNSVDDVFLLYGDGRIETKGKSINFTGSENQGNPGISFQNGSSTYWIGHNGANNMFFIGGTGGTTPEMGAINILGGNVGIGTNTPAKALDVNGDFNLTGNIYKNNQLIDFEQWDVNGANISYSQGNVGIGTPIADFPNSKLHISTNTGNTTESFFKVENSGQPGSGITTIGKQEGGGPVIIQQAGSTTFTTQGSTLGLFQKSANGDTGFGISTYTATEGTVRWVDMFAPTSDCYLRAEDNLFLRSRTGSVRLETNDGIHYIHLNANGQMGIGTETHIDNNFTKLTVAGRIHAQEVKVTVNAGADFVFDNEYPLPRIVEVENFIIANNHLPGIPSSDEMQQNGLDLGEMQIKLLQKIEELTLYVIELKKENVEMKEEINKLKED